MLRERTIRGGGRRRDGKRLDGKEDGSRMETLREREAAALWKMGRGGSKDERRWVGEGVSGMGGRERN